MIDASTRAIAPYTSRVVTDGPAGRFAFRLDNRRTTPGELCKNTQVRQQDKPAIRATGAIKIMCNTLAPFSNEWHVFLLIMDSLPARRVWAIAR